MEQQMQQPQPQGDDLSAASITSKFQVPPQLQKAYEKIVLAGMKVMFDPQTHEMALQQLDGEGPIEDRLSTGIMGLMAILWQQSNQTMPPQLIVPAAVALYLQAVEFLKKSGEEITPEQLSGGLVKTITLLLEKFGVDPKQIQQLFGGGADMGAAMQKAGAPEAPQQGGGLIGGAMQGGAQ